MPTQIRPPRSSVSAARRVALVAVVVVVVLLGSTGIASAHASLVATDPGDGQSVPEPPTRVTATFTEPVTADVGGLTVRDRDGDVVDLGDSTAEGTTLSVSLPSDLADGTYIATYRVLSADGHPVNGSWVFGIGSGPVDLSAGGDTGDAPWELAGGGARFVTYLSALLAAGVAFFLAFLHDQRADRWKLVPVVRIAAVVGLVGVLGIIATQAALLTGDGLGAALDGDVLRSVLTDRLGWAMAVLLLGLAAVHVSTDTNRLLLAQVLAFYGGLAVTGSFALWGHDTEAPARWLSVGSDVVHVAAAAVWLGGLVGLFLVLRRRAPHPVRSTCAVVSRFSNTAAASVLLLAAAGVAMAWIEVGTPEGLWSTVYGRLVLVKVAITLVVVALAAHNRFRLIPALLAGADADPEESDDLEASDDLVGQAVDQAVESQESEEQAWRWSELRRVVGYEALALVAVLAFTAVLVNTTPARTVVEGRPEVVNLTDDVPTGTLNLVVTPGQVGTNTLHIQYFGPDGRPVDVAPTATVEMSLPSRDLGPLTRQVLKISPGHFILEGDELSLPGEWTVTIGVRTDDFTEQRTSFTVPIAS